MIKTVEFEGSQYRIGFRYVNWQKGEQNSMFGPETTFCMLFSRKTGLESQFVPGKTPQFEPQVSAWARRHSADAPNRNIARDAAFRNMLAKVQEKELRKLLAEAYFGRKGKKNANA